MNARSLVHAATVAVVLVSLFARSATAERLQELTQRPTDVHASSDDGNIPSNTIDGDLGTRWSAYGDGQWIRYDLGGVTNVSYVALAVYQGDARRNRFDLQVSSDDTGYPVNWRNVITNGLTTGDTPQSVVYEFPDVQARWVRYVGHGSTVGGWNSLTDVRVYQSQYTKRLPVAVTASAHDGNAPANTVDSHLGTRWSAYGIGQWLQFDLGGLHPLGLFKVAAYRGDMRSNLFDLQVSQDGNSWTHIFRGNTWDDTATLHTVTERGPIAARYVRYVGWGNTSADPSTSQWNSVTELEVWSHRYRKLVPVCVAASADDGNAAAGAVDGDRSTYWAADRVSSEDAPYLELDLGRVYRVGRYRFASPSPTAFEVQISTNGFDYVSPTPGHAPPPGNELGTQDESEYDVRFVRLVGSQSDRIALSEVEIWGTEKAVP